MSILAGDLVEASNLTDLYDRLNALRRKVGLSNITVPTPQNSRARARDINSLDAEMTTFASSSQARQWYTKADDYTSSAGELIGTALGNNLLTQFDTWDQVCYQHYASNYYDYADYNNKSNNCPSYVCQWSGNSGICTENCTAYNSSENSNKTQVAQHTGTDASWCWNNT